MNVRLLGVFLACGFSIPVAQAQMLQPGLWEVTSSNMQFCPSHTARVSMLPFCATPVALNEPITAVVNSRSLANVATPAP